jgi:Outer membrane protein beta-barrel domain
MKKILVILFVLFISSVNFAQWGTSAIKLGYFSPSATDGGFIIGYEGGKFIDRGFIFGWSIDWFRKSYVDKKLVAQFDDLYGIAGGSINEVRAKTNIHDFPLMLTATGKFPVSPFVNTFITGGIGAEVLIIDYNNFVNTDQSELHGAFDFNWRLGIGIGYELGRRSEIFGEIDYHSSMPSWEYDVKDNYGVKRTFERQFDMSGIMMRIGIRFYH